MNNEKIIDGLNDLLAKNYDSERGYKNAAEKTGNLALAAFFRSKASTRYAFGHEIKELIKSLQGEPEKGTSFAGDVHNAWINFKAALNLDSEESILDAVEDGEEACLKEYEEFLKIENLPSDVRRTISKQMMQITRALRRVERYEDMYA